MRRRDFEALVRGMAAEVPPHFLGGIAAIEVTGKTVPHPLREDVFTMGECVPHSFSSEDEGPSLSSTVYLHYGSFLALSRITPDFDWREEAWADHAEPTRLKTAPSSGAWLQRFLLGSSHPAAADDEDLNVVLPGKKT